MRICHVSPYLPARDGIARYTAALVEGIGAHGTAEQVIVAPLAARPVEAGPVRCVPAFDPTGDYVRAAAAAVRATGSAVAVLQYTNDHFGDDDRFPRLVAALEAAGVRTVVNLHSVYPAGARTRFPGGGDSAAFDREVGRQASAVQVHTGRMRRDLLARGVAADKVVVIAHGTPAVPARDPAESRRQLGIPVDARVVLLFGFVWSGKGPGFLASVFGRLARRVPGAFLYLGGHSIAPTLDRRLFLAWVRARLLLAGAAGRSAAYGSFVPDEAVPAVFAAADVVALPYRQAYSSASGVAHQAVGAGRIPVCARIAKFDDIAEGVSPELLVEAGDRRRWVEALERALTDEAWAAARREDLRRYARETSWPEIGRRHLALVERLASSLRRISAGAT